MTLHYTADEAMGTTFVIPKMQRSAEARREANRNSTNAVEYVPRLLKLAGRQRLTLTEMEDLLGIPRKRADEWAHTFYEAGIFDCRERAGTGSGNGPKAKEYWLTEAFGGEA